MRTIKKASEGVLFAGMIFLLFILFFEHRLHIPAWLKVAGRMHPMFLHFPIVLLLLSFLSLWIPSHEERVWRWFEGLRLVAALSAVITAIMGLILSVEENGSGPVLQWHKWAGIAVAVFGYVFYWYGSFFIHNKIVGKSFTFFGTITIIFTGHLGSDLTHGDNYLLAPISTEKKVPVEEAIIFNDVIRPVLEKKCGSCHGEGSIKGGLLLENVAGILKGGKTGPLFVPGAPDISLLIQRIHLSPDDKKHMPPKSKPALADDEAALLYAWIKSGALLNKKLTTLPAKDSFRMIASRFLGEAELVKRDPDYDFPFADNKTISSLNNNYRAIEQLGMNSPALAVHFYGQKNYSPQAISELLGLKQQVTELSLARMPVKDEDLKIVNQFPNLKKLNLNYTDVTDKGLNELGGMKKLQQISLSGTKVSSASLQKILSLPELAEIFIWNTPMDSVQLNILREKNRKMRIETGFIDNGELIVPLSPPQIRVPAGILDNDTVVEIVHPFKGVDIRYTLDGSIPDSITSELYTKPVLINHNTTLIARAFKNGWYGSTPTQSAYIKRGVRVDSIELITPPDQKYRTSESSLLSDGDLGDVNYENGKWLGYRNNEAAYYLLFLDTVSARHVLLNMLQHTGGYIFPPAKLEVWGGMDKNQMKLLAHINPSMPKKGEPAKLIQEEIQFAPTTLRYIKIVAQPLKSLPTWHPGKGKPGWVFVSEIVVN